MKELKKRIILRNTETPKQIKQRMSRFEEEMKYIGLFDHIVVNDDLKKCVNKIKKIIRGNI
jgi:guanylate kinase